MNNLMNNNEKLRSSLFLSLLTFAVAWSYVAFLHAGGSIIPICAAANILCLARAQDIECTLSMRIMLIIIAPLVACSFGLVFFVNSIFISFYMVIMTCASFLAVLSAVRRVGWNRSKLSV